METRDTVNGHLDAVLRAFRSFLVRYLLPAYRTRRRFELIGRERKNTFNIYVGTFFSSVFRVSRWFNKREGHAMIVTTFNTWPKMLGL